MDVAAIGEQLPDTTRIVVVTASVTREARLPPTALLLDDERALTSTDQDSIRHDSPRLSRR